MRAKTLLLLIGFAGGCTGMTLDESMPGSDTWAEPTVVTSAPDASVTLSHGALAVDHRDDTVFVVQSKRTIEHEDRTLTAITSDRARNVADLDGLRDVRVLFPEGSVMVMGERDGLDELRLLEPGTYREIDRAEGLGQYNGTRLSGSRRYLAVAANELDHAPIHLIDTRTLEVAEIAHRGDWLEAMWTHESDVLLAIVFYTEGTRPWGRILAWDMKSIGSVAAFENESTFPEPMLDLRVDDIEGDAWFSYSWIGVSPDDTLAVFPVNHVDRESRLPDHQLLVVDLATARLRTVDYAKGPVGFTPDGRTIVSYGTNMLKMIDVDTLESEDVPLPVLHPEFYVSRGGNFVAIAEAYGYGAFVIYDVDAGTMTTLERNDLRFIDFVSRDAEAELWMVDRGLFRVDLMGATVEQIELAFVPAHINRLPIADELVVDDSMFPELFFLDPDSGRVVRRRTLPTP